MTITIPSKPKMFVQGIHSKPKILLQNVWGFMILPKQVNLKHLNHGYHNVYHYNHM